MGKMRVIVEWAFYCHLNGETYDGYDTFGDALAGIARLIKKGFTEDDFGLPYPVWGDA